MNPATNSQTSTVQPILADPFAQTFAQAFAPKRAVSYLRVSTKRQANRGGEAEGFSIPAQRDANKKKAQTLGAVVVKEFVDRGESARSANRPALQEMLEYILDNEVDFVIVHKVDRLARNREDDTDIMRQLKAANVQLVSTTENIDDTPQGKLVHGIFSTFAEFYSNNLSTEVVKGMSKKVEFGGTPGRAPLGYMNRILIGEDGRENRTIIIDKTRGPLITRAFELYATGEWSNESLADHLAARGLTTRGTALQVSKPVDAKTLMRSLSNPYYRGIVTYKGVQYDGKHPRLIDDETWHRVQAIRHSHRNGERNRKHPHFLRGTVYCGQCQSRLIVMNARSSTGDIYPYYYCSGRQSRRTNCDLTSVLISELEKKITHDYHRNIIPEDLQEHLTTLVRDQLLVGEKDALIESAQLKRETDKLERERLKLIQAHYADAIPVETLKAEQDRITGQLTEIARRTATLDAGIIEVQDRLTIALKLMTNCHTAYKNASDHVKRLFNQAFYIRILIQRDGTIKTDLNTPFQSLRSPLLQRKAREQAQIMALVKNKGAEANGSRSLVGADQAPTSLFQAVRFSTDKLVGLTGFEPATP